MTRDQINQLYAESTSIADFLIAIGVVKVDEEISIVEKQRKGAASVAAGLCGCWRCLEVRGEMRFKMIVCPICNYKRCPKASNHDLACTASNERGQSGSVFTE